MDEQEYMSLVEQCTLVVLTTGARVSDVISDPMGPASYYVGRIDLDMLAECVLLSAMASLMDSTFVMFIPDTN